MMTFIWKYKTPLFTRFFLFLPLSLLGSHLTDPISSRVQLPPSPLGRKPVCGEQESRPELSRRDIERLVYSSKKREVLYLDHKRRCCSDQWGASDRRRPTLLKVTLRRLAFSALLLSTPSLVICSTSTRLYKSARNEYLRGDKIKLSRDYSRTNFLLGLSSNALRFGHGHLRGGGAEGGGLT